MAKSSEEEEQNGMLHELDMPDACKARQCKARQCNAMEGLRNCLCKLATAALSL
jgi:hypothetical protein